MNVRKPLLSPSALKLWRVTIIFNHDDDCIIFKKETVNLISNDCHSYLRLTLTNGIPHRQAMVTWTKKSTLVMVSTGRKLKKLVLVTGERSPMRTKRDSLTSLVRQEQRWRCVLLE